MVVPRIKTTSTTTITTGGIPNPRTQLKFFWMSGNIQRVTNVPAHKAKYHQLKNELWTLHSSRFCLANWSAPKAWMQGLNPHCPNATIYSEKKNSITWNRRELNITLFVFWSPELLREGRVAERVNMPRPYKSIQSKSAQITSSKYSNQLLKQLVPFPSFYCIKRKEE